MRFVGGDKGASLVGDSHALQRSGLLCSELRNNGFPCRLPIPNDGSRVDGDFWHFAESRPELPALDGDPHRAFEACQHIATVSLFYPPDGVRDSALEGRICLAEVCAVMLENRRPSEILCAEWAGARGATTLPLRHPTYPVSYPCLAALAQASQMLLDAHQSCRVHGR